MEAGCTVLPRTVGPQIPVPVVPLVCIQSPGVALVLLFVVGLPALRTDALFSLVILVLAVPDLRCQNASLLVVHLFRIVVLLHGKKGNPPFCRGTSNILPRMWVSRCLVCVCRCTCHPCTRRIDTSVLPVPEFCNPVPGFCNYVVRFLVIPVEYYVVVH